MAAKSKPVKPVAGYARLSISKDTSVSIAAQQQMLERWAAAHGVDICMYTDDGFSGSKDIERPALERLLVALDAGEHDTIVVKSVDRLGRRLKGFIELADRARIVTVEGGIDTGTPTGRMMLSLLSTFAEFEAAQIGQRQAVSQAYRRQNGLAVGAPPFGYTHAVVDGNNVRVVVDEEAKYVIDAFERLLDGDSIRSIADWLNGEGVKTRQGNQWSAATTSQMLANPTYAGYRIDGEDYIRDASGLPIVDDHLALITLTQWQRAQQMKATRQTFAPKGRKHARLLLAGLAFCGGCGGALQRNQATVRGKIYVNYRCGADAKSLCAKRPIISARVLDKYIADLLEPIMGMPCKERVIEIDAESTRKRALLQGELDALGESLGKSGVAEMQDIFARMQTLRAQLDAIEIRTVETERLTGETFGDVWGRDPRMVIDQAIERIVLNEAGRKPVEERVVVIWRDGQEPD